MSNYEGGIRVPALIAGGIIPPNRVGSSYAGLVAVYDFYAVAVNLAGGSLADPKAEAAGLPPVDAIDLSGALLGWPKRSTTTARTELAIGTQNMNSSVRNVAGLLMVLVAETDRSSDHSAATPTKRLFKLLTGLQNQVRVASTFSLVEGSFEVSANLHMQASHSGPLSPNSTENATLSFSSDAPDSFAVDCGIGGCLYDLVSDEGERTDLAVLNRQEHEAILAKMHKQLQAMRKSALVMQPGPTDEAACVAALRRGGFWGPW